MNAAERIRQIEVLEAELALNRKFRNDASLRRRGLEDRIKEFDRAIYETERKLVDLLSREVTHQ